MDSAGFARVRLLRNRQHGQIARLLNATARVSASARAAATSAPRPVLALASVSTSDSSLKAGFLPWRQLLSRGALSSAESESVHGLSQSDPGNHDGTHLSPTAYEATHTFLLILLIFFLFSLLLTLPSTLSRIRHSTSWLQGFILRRSSLAELQERNRLAILAPVHRRALQRVPARLPYFTNPIPARRIPWIGLTYTQAVIVAGLWITGAVSAWADAHFVWEGSRSAYIVLVLLVLSVLLAAKAGGLGTVLGCGYASLNFLHRWTGRLVVLMTTLHVLAYLVLFLQRGIFKHEMSMKPNILATMSYAGMCLIGIVSIGPIRRRCWIAFKVGHHVGIIIMLGGLNYHSPASVPYIIVLFTVLGLNSTLRLVTTRFQRATLTVLPGAGTTLVTLPLTAGYFPGQHLRIRVWSSNRKMGFAGWLEAHPFSIASAPGPDNEIRLLVKKAGDWSNGLYDLAQGGQSIIRGGKAIQVERQVLVTVEGPYGGPINFNFPSFEGVMVCAGGSGVSHALSVAEGMVRNIKRGAAACRNLVFIWTVRDQSNLEALYPLLQSLIEEAESLEYVCPDFTLSVELYFTARQADSPLAKESSQLRSKLSSVNTSVFNRRPDWNALLLRQALDISRHGDEKGGGIGVTACGPPLLVDSVKNTVRKIDGSDAGRRAGGLAVHTESFSF